MSLSPTETAWLAGIFDGEGSARIYRHAAKNYFFCQVDALTSTDPEMIEKVEFLLASVGIGFNTRNNQNDRRNSKHSAAWTIRITKYCYVEAFLSLILPFTTGQKKHQAELLLSFVRLSRPNRGRKGRTANSAAADLELYAKQHFRPHRTEARLQ